MRGWLPGLTRDPPGLHAMLNLFHEPVREEYLADLKAAVEEAQASTGSGVEAESVY